MSYANGGAEQFCKGKNTIFISINILEHAYIQDWGRIMKQIVVYLKDL